MKWYDAKTVQKGRMLPNVDAVRKRLIEIRDNPRSAYHKDFNEGRIHVLKSKHAKNGKRGEYDLVVLQEIHPPVKNMCAGCSGSFFSLEENDYLCPTCRANRERG